jgi:ribosomal protein S18 acetylase RimI-like enzyme
MQREPSERTSPPAIRYRTEPAPQDCLRVADLITETGFFHEAEKQVAVELIEEALSKGEAGGYFFVFAEAGQELAGYACYGPIACTLHGYDIYWIAVSPRFQGQGLGRALLDEAERRIRDRGGRQSYIETSARAQYLPTRGFYLRCGYAEAARLTDFYAEGDDKVIYRKTI